jgi:hypothetical protein
MKVDDGVVEEWKYEWCLWWWTDVLRWSGRKVMGQECGHLDVTVHEGAYKMTATIT